MRPKLPVPFTVFHPIILRPTYSHIVHKELGGNRQTARRPTIKEQCHRPPGVAGQLARHVETHLLPVVRGIGVAGVLQFPNGFSTTIQQRYSKGISTRMRCARCVAIPPVTQCDSACIARHSKVLRDTIVAVAVATEVRAVLPAMGIRCIHDFIAAAGRLMPRVKPLLEVAVLNQ